MSGLKIARSGVYSALNTSAMQARSMIEHRCTAEIWVAKAAPVLAILCIGLVGSSCGSKAHHDNAKPRYSQDWSPVVAELTATEMSDYAIEKAKKAGLLVMAENEINGDRHVEVLDPVTGALVFRESIYVDRFPPPLPPANLKRPVLVYPPNRTVFDGYPRKTELRWQSVPGAAWYVVQVDLGWLDGPESTSWASEMGGGYKQETTTDTTFRFEFAGAQAGRWRVWAVDVQGMEGPKSPWRTFRYTK